MPLVRVGVRNEYSLGATELYRDADKEDPKALLDGVAVSGLVGILRQLGDLAEFAAEVFHGLQEQVTVTSSRSHKLMARVQRIETALPSLEKSILAQQSHLHFAYTAGSNWHTRIHCEENHFIYSDLPRFIMDSYEECHGPPRLHLLDKFDPGGPGSCLKRYSDPTFFKRASAGSDEAYLEKVLKDKKGRKIKKKRSWQKNREVSCGASSLSNYSSRMESRKIDGQTSPSQRISTNGETMLKSDLQELSQSFDSTYGSACVEGVSCPSSLMHPDEDKAKEISSLLKSHHDDSLDYCSFDEKSGDNSVSISLSQEQSDHFSSHATRNKQGQPEEEDSRQSFSNSLQMYSNGSLDSVHPDEKSGDIYGDISNGYSEEHNGVTWNGKTQPEEDESRLSFSAPLQMHSNGSLDYHIPDENNGDSCVDIGNGLSEEHSAYILYSVTRNDNARPLELVSKESLYSPSQMNQDNCIDVASPDEKIWVVSDETGCDFSQNQACPSPSCSTMHREMDTSETAPQKCNDVENVETHSANVGADAQITAAVTLDSVEQIDTLLERMNQKDTTDFASQDENIWVVSDETGSNFSQKQTCPYPSCSTLGRTIDTLETNPQKCDDENLETHSANAGADAQITAAVTLDTVNQIDLLLEKMNQKDSIDFASPDEKIWVVSDEIGSDFSQKQTCPIPSCSTLDRKMDTLEIIHQRCNDNENLETHSANVGTDAQITAAVTRGSVEQIDMLLENKKMQMSNYDDVPFDDIDSETDNFVDALNTIESESESDLDCQTKKQLDLDSYLKTKVVEDAMPEVIAKYADSLSPNLTSEAGEIPAGKDIFGDNSSAVPSDHDSAACFSLDKVTCEDTFHSNTSECNARIESPQVSKGTVEPGLPHGNLNENGDALDTSDVESVSKLSPSVSRENGTGMINKVTCPEPPKPPPEPSGVTSVKFWTNGGLLGLEPSKPPDSVLKAVTQVSSTTQDDTIGTPGQNNDPMGEKRARTSCVTENGSKNREESQHSTRCHDNQDGGVFVMKTSSRFSSVDLDARVEKSNHSCHQNNINSPPDSHFNESDTVPSGTLLPVAPDSQRTSISQENVNNSSRILSLGNRLLVNGFHRKLSLGWENNSNSASSMTSGLSEQKNHYENVTARTFSQKTTDLSGTGSPIMSPSWSPPLGHMKISFQPVDGFEAYKLKLRFPDRGTRQESSSDMFPSFQLVPDAAIPLHDMSSDSDNDTFCRSSPYASDDCLSHQSESNSEQWESGESSSTKDHEVYDALRRISLTESTSTSFDNRLTTQEELHDNGGGQIPFSEHGFEQSSSGYFYDLPILDTLRPPVKQESGNCSTSIALLERQSPKEPTPPPPSIPPQGWQPTRSHSDLTDGREGSLPKGLNYTVDKKLQAATFLHQPKPAPLNQDQVIEPAFGLRSKRLDLQQMDGQKVASQAENGKEMEEKEDFLHQIRTKSFNLRPTVTAKPTQTTGLPTSVNAILEKANAIRQAVGSDGEDDNWSDT